MPDSLLADEPPTPNDDVSQTDSSKADVSRIDVSQTDSSKTVAIFENQLGLEHITFETSPHHETFEQLAPHERIKNLDILRGFALVGITLVNTLTFSYPQAYYQAMSFPGLSPLDKAVEWAIVTFAKTAFYPLFAFLFGVGMAIQEVRGLEHFQNPKAFLRRRFFFLLLIGVVHGSFIWMGDILSLYALSGYIFLLIPKANLKRTLVIAASCFLLAFIGLYLMRFLVSQFPSGLSAQLLLNTYSDGTFYDLSLLRLKDFYYNFILSSIYALPHVLGFMLLGYSVAQSSVLYIPEAHQYWLKRIVLIALLVALVFKLPYIIMLLQGDVIRLWRYLAIIIGGPALGAFYVGMVLRTLQNFRLRQWLTPLAYLGRMALSNYLLQSVVFTLVYYSYGLGFYGEVGTAKAVALALCVVALQGLVSKHWLEHFRYGPLEWLWRSLSYGKQQSIK